MLWLAIALIAENIIVLLGMIWLYNKFVKGRI